MKRLVRNKQQCGDMPRGVARRVLKMADEDGDGRLDFEEFFALSQEHDWLVGHYVARYCHWIVPDPHRHDMSTGGAPDQIGERRVFFDFVLWRTGGRCWILFKHISFILVGQWPK